jgi:hypothetical protein
MCKHCRTLDLRATRLVVLAVLRDERTVCAALKRTIDAEIVERMAALDIDDPRDEQV